MSWAMSRTCFKVGNHVLSALKNMQLGDRALGICIKWFNNDEESSSILLI